jgi:hypothetical protein
MAADGGAAGTRETRVRPGKGGGTPTDGRVELPTVRLVAPTGDGGTGHNTIRLTTWFELRLLSPRAKPLVGERCQMFDPTGKVVEKKTDKDGVVRFDELTFIPPAGASFDDVASPAVIFPDILEEWVPAPAGDFGKHAGERDDYRKRDGAVYFVPKLETRTDVTFVRLPEDQKLQHFMDAYVDNKAHYDTAHPNSYAAGDCRWNWGKGSVCNQHVNFFLGYWFNYNDKFTTRGSATVMSVLPMFSSDNHKFGTVTHRGYLEFLEPVNGYGAALGTAYDPDDDSTWPKVSEWSKTFRHFEYIRIARYFDWTTQDPTSDGQALIDALGSVNVYSLSDIKQKDAADAEKAIRAWLKKHRASKANNQTDQQIDGKSSTALWEIAFDLDDGDNEDLELVTTLRGKITWDHHAGVLLVRAKGGGPVTAATKEKELWTFSADGATTPGPLIVFKKLADADLKRRFVHLGIWRCKALTGGFAPADAADNEGHVSIDNPPRFIHWG